MAHDPSQAITGLLEAKRVVDQSRYNQARYRIAPTPCSIHGQALLYLIPRHDGLPCPECFRTHGAFCDIATLRLEDGHWRPERIEWHHSGGWGIDWAWRMPE